MKKLKELLKTAPKTIGGMIGATIFILLVMPVMSLIVFILIKWFWLWYNAFEWLTNFCKTIL